MTEVDSLEFSQVKDLLCPGREDDLIISAEEVVMLDPSHLIGNIVDQFVKINATGNHGLIRYTFFQLGKTNQEMVGVKKVVTQRAGRLLCHPYGLLSTFCQVCPVHGIMPP